jgi:HAE1 family hydrophobic/amphiphilic exporter-1
MSSTTTIIAMLPIATGIGGKGSAILAPLAVTIMGGLFSSTILTLIVLPCLTILVTRFIESRFGMEEEISEEGVSAP